MVNFYVLYCMLLVLCNTPLTLFLGLAKLCVAERGYLSYRHLHYDVIPFLFCNSIHEDTISAQLIVAFDVLFFRMFTSHC